MAWSFGDSFDLYTAIADAANGYWDVGGSGAAALLTGRFAGSRAWQSQSANNVSLIKASNINDAVHHVVLSFQQTFAITGSSFGMQFQLLDGATIQCSVSFRSDGAIVLYSGAVGGTVLATYTGAFSLVNTWYAFEFEIVINNTTGAFRVRKNGNTVNDFDSGAVLNTRGGTTNNYANKLQIGQTNNYNGHSFDDFFWQSGASTGAWLGDIRCYARMPVSDQSVTFSRSPTNWFMQTTATANSNTPLSAGVIRSTSVVATATGTLASLSFNFNAAMTGHAKMALYDATGAGGGAGALLASSTELTNPGAGVNVFPVTGGPAVTKGVTYWVAIWSDASLTGNGSGSSGLLIDLLTLTYTTSFPSTMAGFTTNTGNNLPGMGSNGMNVTGNNNSCVSEAQQDGSTTYVFDSNPGDADFYGIGSIGSTPATVIATTTRAYAQKSDAGTRTLAVQMKSSATTVASPTLVLTTSNFSWAWRIDLTDPATGAAWTPAAVNNVQIGPKVIA